MKKLVLSAVFAVACFTAQAQTTIKTPETKEIPTQVSGANAKSALTCCETRSVEVICMGGPMFTVSATRCARGSCELAASDAYTAIYTEAGAACDCDFIYGEY